MGNQEAEMAGANVEAKGQCQCLYPSCRKPQYLRGLCTTHYQQTWARQRRGETSWEAEVAAGRARTARRNKRFGKRCHDR